MFRCTVRYRVTTFEVHFGWSGDSSFTAARRSSKSFVDIGWSVRRVATTASRMARRASVIMTVLLGVLVGLGGAWCAAPAELAKESMCDIGCILTSDRAIVEARDAACLDALDCSWWRSWWKSSPDCARVEACDTACLDALGRS